MASSEDLERRLAQLERERADRQFYAQLAAVGLGFFLLWRKVHDGA